MTLNKRWLWGYGLIYILAISSFMWLGTFSRMIADDYCGARNARDFGLWQSVVARYETWSGRFSTYILTGLLSPFQPTINALLPTIQGITLFILVYLFIVQISQLKGFSKLVNRVTIASILTFFLINISPSPQNLYWLSAMIPHSLPLLGFLALMLGSIWLSQNQYLPYLKKSIGIVLILLAFFNGGLSEIITIMQITGFILLWLYYRNQQKSFLWVVKISLMVSILAMLLIVLAPGNYVRQDMVIAQYGDTRPSLLGLLERLSYFTLALFFIENYALANQATVFLGSIALCFLLYRGTDRQTWAQAQAHLGWKALLASAVALILVTSMLFPSLYATGNVSSRTLWSSRLVLLALFSYWGYLTAAFLAQRHFPSPHLARRPVYRLVALAIAGLLLVMPLIALMTNLALVPNFASYARDWDARHATLQTAAQTGDLNPNVPRLSWYIEDYLLLEKVEADPDDEGFVAICAARYYGLESIVIPPAPQEGT